MIRSHSSLIKCFNHHIQCHLSIQHTLYRSINTSASNRCIVFAGQGSLHTNLTPEFYHHYAPITEPIWSQINAAVQQDLCSILYKPQLTTFDVRRTDIAQPAIYGICISTLHVLLNSLQLNNVTELAQYTMGHSLGELTALSASNVLSISETAAILHVRGRSMYDACSIDTGAMCVLQPTSIPYSTEICKLVQQQYGTDTVCSISAINSHNQIVLSGHKYAIERAVVIARTGVGKHPPIKLAKLLNVTSPFHCALMKSAVKPFSDAVDTIQFSQLHMNVISNVDGTAHTIGSDGNQLKSCLINQLTEPVQWYQSVLTALQNNVTEFIEVSPTRVLAPLITGIAQFHQYHNVRATCISTVQDVQNYVQNAQR